MILTPCPYDPIRDPVLVGRNDPLAGQPISKIYSTPLFFKMACKQNLDLRCVLISDPGTLGAGAKTRPNTPKAVTYHEQPHHGRFMIGHSLGRMESRIKKFTPHCVCRPISSSRRGTVQSWHGALACKHGAFALGPPICPRRLCVGTPHTPTAPLRWDPPYAQGCDLS